MTPLVVSETLLSPEAKKGEIVVRDAVKDVVSEEVFNLFMSLAPLVNGMHLLDSVLLLFIQLKIYILR